MSSDSGTDDDSEFNIEDIFGEDGIQPFRFEPICSDSESEDGSTSGDEPNHLHAESENSMDWCEYVENVKRVPQ